MPKPKRYVKGKYANAACDLDDELSRLGIRHSGVGYRSGRRDKTLIVMLISGRDRKRVPATFGEFSVETQVAGVIRACAD